jgi:hypothetical protein
MSAAGAVFLEGSHCGSRTVPRYRKSLVLAVIERHLHRPWKRERPGTGQAAQVNNNHRERSD